MKNNVAITTSGHYMPEDYILTEELVKVYNRHANKYNEQHISEIESGKREKLQLSESEFIIKASGIRKRHVLNRSGILNENLMHPVIENRENHQLAFQSELGLKAVLATLNKANKNPKDVDGIIVACSNMQRPYPAIAIEIQKELGMEGWAYDMNAACSSATFGISAAYNSIKAGVAKSILVVCPEVYTAHINFTDRKSHFIFGDGAAAILIEQSNAKNSSFEILSCQIKTKFSNNIRNNLGFLNRIEADNNSLSSDKYFIQNGRNVREEVVPLAIRHIKEHLARLNIPSSRLKKLWLHQANANMNKEIADAVFECDSLELQAPTILSDYGNVGAAGVIITFDMFNHDLKRDDIGVICSFGAGYSVGSVIIKKL